MLQKLAVPEARDLLDRIRDASDPAALVQRLDPDVLHALVRATGLEEAGPIVALATPEQLTRILDEDLWTPARPGTEEPFDGRRFGTWLEVLVDVGVEVAARRVVEMDFDLVTAGLADHVLVLDDIASSAADAWPGVAREWGPFVVLARREECWDAVVALLTCLEASHREFFGRLMRRCWTLSNEYIEDNGGLHEVLTAAEQVLSDVAAAREERREQAGYISPTQAAAFLTLARRKVEDEPQGWDHLTRAYFRAIGRDRSGHGARTTTTPAAAVRLESATALLPDARSGEAARFARIRTLLLQARERGPAVHARREEELGYLANVLIAGCSFQSRGFAAGEAARAALAACNLGLENWPAAWAPPTPEQDLVAVFRVGWNIAYERVCLYTARHAAEVLADLHVGDAETARDVAELSRRLRAQASAGAPWRERDRLDVLAILDTLSWSTLLGLLDECPVVPPFALSGGRPPLRVPSEFDFLSENAQVAWARKFLRSLPQRLAPHPVPARPRASSGR
jgi:hypothetical protein